MRSPRVLPFAWPDIAHAVLGLWDDATEWSWKDEDELEEAVRRGLVTEERAQELRADGERALERLRRRDRPFERDWSHWRPDPTWSHPTIPNDPGLLR